MIQKVKTLQVQVTRLHLQIHEPLALEELVCGEGESRAHARDGGVSVSARAQVREAAQELLRVALLLQWILGRTLA